MYRVLMAFSHSERLQSLREARHEHAILSLPLPLSWPRKGIAYCKEPSHHEVVGGLFLALSC